MSDKKQPEFETRPAWKTPIFCETIKDETDNPTGVKLSIGILIPVEDSKWELMDAMSDALEKVLREKGLIE